MRDSTIDVAFVEFSTKIYIKCDTGTHRDFFLTASFFYSQINGFENMDVISMWPVFQFSKLFYMLVENSKWTFVVVVALIFSIRLVKYQINCQKN